MTFMSAPEFKVGLLVLAVSSLIGGMSMQASEDPGYLGGKSRKHWFLVDDATGLVTNSVVKMAGVNVGSIKKITLQDNRARIDLSIQDDLPLTTNSSVRIKAFGLLGDRVVEVVLNDGKCKTPVRPRVSGAEIRNSTEGGSMDVIMDEIGKISKSLGEIAESVKEATTGPGDPKHPLGRIIRNIEKLTEDMADVVGTNKGQLTNLINQMAKLSEKLNEIMGDTQDDGFRAAWNDAVSSLKRIEKALANVEEITDKVNRGEGTLGKLVNDDTIVTELNTTVKGVNELLQTARKIETSIDFHSELLTEDNKAKSFIGLRIQPGMDRYYEIAVVDDPKGVVTTVDEAVSVGGGAATNTTTVTTFKNKTRLTALFAKNFYNFTIKGGLMESEGGVGFDYYFFDRNLRLSLESFDFEDMHLRVFARYNVWKGVYLTAGGDDLADSTNVSGFLGAGRFITNEDLKLLFARAPS
mgnify:CR=1 FL=1